MTISATVSVTHLTEANTQLEAAGHGPSNFSVPLRTGNARATHAGLHAWDDPSFLAALQALTVPTLRIRNEPGAGVNFGQHVAAEAMEWTDPTLWFDNPVMTGDIRQFGGVQHRSLIDYNVWTPEAYPRGWERVNDPTPENVWQVNTVYTTGDRVFYPTTADTEYECRQSHTSQAGWEPPNVPALWLAL